MKRSEVQRLKQLDNENRRLKQIVAEQTFDRRSSQKRGKPERSAHRGGVGD